MKIDRQELKEALWLSALEDYSDIPREEEIEHSFSPQFHNWARELSRKSEKSTWRYWQISKHRIVLIAVIIAILICLVACAPTIKKLFVRYFLVNRGDSYGIMFDMSQATSAPSRVEKNWIPNWSPDGYRLVCNEVSELGTTYIWKKPNGGYISYDQSVIPQTATNSIWIGIDADGAQCTSEVINTYQVEIIHMGNEFVAVWTDNDYLYKVCAAESNIDSVHLVQQVMDSLATVEAAGTVG